MKILSAEAIKMLDKYTIEHEPITSLDLMERAAENFCDWFTAFYDENNVVRIICGPGNNSGDGLAIGRMLHSQGYNVEIDLVNSKDIFSKDATQNIKALPQDVPLRRVKKLKDLPLNYSSEIIIDALFGSGLSRKLEGLYGDVVMAMNSWNAEIISVDIPSGLYCDNDIHEGPIVQALHTVSFQLPKLAFFLPDNAPIFGEWHVVDINLHPEGIRLSTSDFDLVEEEDVQKLIKIRSKYSHKGDFGHALIIGGSKGKIGAALLAGKACLRTGAGLLSIQVPSVGYEIIQNGLPEAMCIADAGQERIMEVPDLDGFTAMGMGPGLGKAEATLQVLEEILETWKKSLVIDADALNLLSEHEYLLKKLPKDCILTPHPGEFKRLVGQWANGQEKLALQQAFSKNYNCIVVLKGANTSISDCDGHIFFNNTGNPGMATAGSGDVLTGMITGLLSQGYEPIDAAKLAVHLHGLSGDLALDKQSMESLIACDIIDHIGEAFMELQK